jgi:hypothetical protein
MVQRHTKKVPTARCCWVCGKLGGDGMTHALKFLGYDVPNGVVAHAHPRCIANAQRKAKRK